MDETVQPSSFLEHGFPEQVDQADFWERLGRQYIDQREWAAARSALESALHLQVSPERLAALAQVCQHLGDEASALRYWSWASRISPRNRPIRRARALARERVKHTQHPPRRWGILFIAWLNGFWANWFFIVVGTACFASLAITMGVAALLELHMLALPAWIACWPGAYISVLLLVWIHANPRYLALVQTEIPPGWAWHPLWRGWPLVCRRIVLTALWGLIFLGAFWVFAWAMSLTQAGSVTPLSPPGSLVAIVVCHLLVLTLLGPLHWWYRRTFPAPETAGQAVFSPK